MKNVLVIWGLKNNILKILVLATFLALPAFASASSVWTLTGITDNTYGHSWSLNMVSSSNTLDSSSVIDLYFDDLSDGIVDPNSLLAASEAGNIRIAFNGSVNDMAADIAPDYMGGLFDVGASPIDSDTMSILGVYYSLDLYDSAFFSNMKIETYGTVFGAGRLDSNYNAVWSWNGSGTATRTAVSTVPVPAAAWLFGSGLIGLIGLARRKKA